MGKKANAYEYDKNAVAPGFYVQPSNARYKHQITHNLDIF
jgi:hypothetical protein